MNNSLLSQVYSRSVKGILLFTLILMLVPAFVSSSYFISVLILVGLYTLISTGMNMLMGFAGQISLGHAAFYGVGAYSSAYVTVKLGMPSIVGILVGVLLTAIIAFIVGIPTLKLTGHYLALATLGIGMIAFTFFKQWKDITGGLNGFFGIPALNLFGIEFDSEVKFYYLVWLIALLGILLTRNVVQSRVGRAFRAIHSSEIAANSIGVNIQKYKLQVFILSAVYASIAGSIYAHYVSFINPMLFESKMSIDFLIMSVIGGSGSIWGGLIGSAVFIILGEVLKDVIPMVMHTQSSDEFQIVFFGVMLVVLLIYMPEGLAPAFVKLRNKAFNWLKLSRRRSRGAADSMENP
ncbi:branched-chain amino acid ABC transporter permease [Ferviditalea candida]|uniref:Branched-chain amino acid ABC transporter permease n=1 Tax=Ferviditalea candida TaxID=3108399 RepID=A0ABU5ZK77_9BACL|nr:branched-chain amino acid ABC transporter permease [Paenibacillaceae bacterium T2]